MQNPEEVQPLTSAAPDQREVNLNDGSAGTQQQNQPPGLQRQKSMADKAKEKMSPQKLDEASNYSSAGCGLVFAILIGVFVYNSNYQGAKCDSQVLTWSKLTFYCLAANSLIGFLSTYLLLTTKKIEGSSIQGFYTFLTLIKYCFGVWSLVNFIALLTFWNKIKTCDTLGTIIYIYLILGLTMLGLIILFGVCCCCICCCAVMAVGSASDRSSNQHIQFSSEQYKIDL